MTDSDPKSLTAADVDLLLSLAASHAMFGRLERAISFLCLALWLSPRHEETLRLLAVLAYRQGDHRRCIATIRVFEQNGSPVPEELLLIKRRLAAYQLAPEAA